MRHQRPKITVLTSAECLKHNPKHEILYGKVHDWHECPQRLVNIKEALCQSQDCQFEFEDVSKDTNETIKALKSIHDPLYIEYLHSAYSAWIEESGNPEGLLPEVFLHREYLKSKNVVDCADLGTLGKSGLYHFDLTSVITGDTWTSILGATACILRAVELISGRLSKADNQVTSDAPAIYVMIRPPGHHASANLCGGYCYINNACIAATQLVSQLQCRVAIVDVDFHHGNGTEAMLDFDSKQYYYLSLHCTPEYPYFSGFESSEFIQNHPLPKSTTAQKYLEVLCNALVQMRRQFKPDILIVSLGVDTWHEDPIAGFEGITDQHFYFEIGKLLKEQASMTLFIQEGGYHLMTIGQNVKMTLEGFAQ